jgi:trimethylamine--corrinoid protein Co-methyltransferase
LQGGRRPGCYRDYCDFLRLAQALNVVHLFGGYPVEPVDLPPETRHLDCTDAFIRLGDKVFFAYSLGRQRILDGIEMTRIARGVSSEQMLREPSLLTVVNSSSPLRIDAPMLEGVIEMARHNQVMVLTPFTLSGAMAPATIAGALAQQNAEALAGLAFSQIVNPGAPVMYGGFTSNVDMKSGAPAFGTPEYTRAALAGGQLARRYNIPYRSSNANACNVVDAQAAYESEMSLWGAIMGHAGLVLHAVGWMEGGLCASFEKMVLDAEMLQMMAEFMSPIEVNEETLGFEAMREVGHGGHLLRDGVLFAHHLGLAQLRELGRSGRSHRHRTGQQALPGNSRRFRAATPGRSAQRRAGGIYRTQKRRGRGTCSLISSCRSELARSYKGQATGSLAVNANRRMTSPYPEYR